MAQLQHHSNATWKNGGRDIGDPESLLDACRTLDVLSLFWAWKSTVVGTLRKMQLWWRGALKSRPLFATWFVRPCLLAAVAACDQLCFFHSLSLDPSICPSFPHSTFQWIPFASTAAAMAAFLLKHHVPRAMAPLSSVRQQIPRPPPCYPI